MLRFFRRTEEPLPYPKGYNAWACMVRTLPKVVGTNSYIQLREGKKRKVVLLNNAATTPPFERTLKRVNKFMQTYGALHRGVGPHAHLTFQQTEAAMQIIREFLGMRDDQALLFTANASMAINLFVRLLRLTKDDVILTSNIEHSSNTLPWQYNVDTVATTDYVDAFDDGSLDYDDLERKVAEYGPRLKLIAITGASSLTGQILDLERLSRLAHGQGAILFIDAAQLAPHRPINMKKQGVDALAFSAHKLYAPFGLGVLAVPKHMLETRPADPGGGSADMVSNTNTVWAPAAERHQTGTLNATGVVATAESCKTIMDTGWDAIIAHEKELTHYAAEQLATVPGITLYVPPEKYLSEDRLGIFTFNLKGIHHALLSAILDNEYSIESRAGTICNHRLVRRWFHVDDAAQKNIEDKIAGGDRLASYGIVRISLGIHNSKKDIDALVSALKSIATGKHALSYISVPAEGIYVCEI